METHPRTSGETSLAVRLDRVVAEVRPHHRLLFLEHLADTAFSPWARARALAEPGNVAHLHFHVSGHTLVTGIVAGYAVEGDGLDDALRTVLTGRTLVLIAGADAALNRLGEPFLAWLDWAAAHLPLTVACTGLARRLLAGLHHRGAAVAQFGEVPDSDAATAANTPRKDP